MQINRVTLTEFRKRASLSQKELADLAGIDRTTITRIEDGTRSPTDMQIIALATALVLPVAAIATAEAVAA